MPNATFEKNLEYYLLKKKYNHNSIEFLQTQNRFLQTMKSNSHLTFHGLKQNKIKKIG